MLTLLLCTAANTVSLLSGPFEYLGWALFGAAILHAAAVSFEARNSPSRAALGQLGRCIATIAAPTVSVTSPFVHFTTLGALLLREDPLNPATFAVTMQAALLCACFLYAGLISLRTSKDHWSLANRQQRKATAIPSAPSSDLMQAQIEDLTLRLALLEHHMQLQGHSPVTAASADAPVRSERPDEDCREGPFDAAASALAEMGYHDGPWNAGKTDDAPAEDQYPPVSDDADFLKVMERP